MIIEPGAILVAKQNMHSWLSPKLTTGEPGIKVTRGEVVTVIAVASISERKARVWVLTKNGLAVVTISPLNVRENWRSLDEATS